MPSFLQLGSIQSLTRRLTPRCTGRKPATRLVASAILGRVWVRAGELRSATASGSTLETR
jgi:hypothetical protein